MADECTEQIGRLEEATNARDDAARDLVDASSDYEDAGGLFDDSSAWDVAGVAGAAAACLVPGIGWLACGAAVVAGGGTVFASEVGRSQEIEAAEAKLDRAWGSYWRAMSRWSNRLGEAFDCKLHHEQKRHQVP